MIISTVMKMSLSLSPSNDPSKEYRDADHQTDRLYLPCPSLMLRAAAAEVNCEETCILSSPVLRSWPTQNRSLGPSQEVRGWEPPSTEVAVSAQLSNTEALSAYVFGSKSRLGSLPVARSFEPEVIGETAGRMQSIVSEHQAWLSSNCDRQLSNFRRAPFLSAWPPLFISTT